MAEVKNLNHLAILVDDMDKVLDFWQDGLGLELAGVEEVPAEGARVAFLPVKGSEIELVMPVGGESGLSRFLEKRGPGMHHVCLEVDDISGMLARLKEKGIQLINEEPRLGLEGRQYAFIHPKSTGGVLVELYEIPD